MQPFLKLNSHVADQEIANVAMMVMLYAPLVAGCCTCCPPVRLGQNPDQNRCPECGNVMEMHRIPSWAEDCQLLFEAGYLLM